MEIAVTWIGESPEPDGLLRATATHLQRALGASAAVVPAAGRPSGALDPRRRQHSSTAILRWLQARVEAAGKVVAVTDADLFIPVLTFVYGEAQLGGPAAVVSIARLRDARAAALTASRLAKEAVHEAGHLFGLVHCGEERCAMRRSASVHDVDVKGGLLCAGCRLRLDEARAAGGATEEAT